VTRVLVTGFEPFDRADVNPSQLLVETFDGDVAKAVLPVSYARAADALRAVVRDAEPEVVICFGQADGRSGISVERFAHNLDEAEPADNDAAAGSGAPIDADGPAAYRSTLPIDEIVASLRRERIPAAPSRDAGGFLCNHVFYVLMRELDLHRPGTIGGFVHVPLVPEQTLDERVASMPLESLVTAARVIVTTCVQSRSPS
jgi:pyroglutamyl-peptidase